MTFSSESSISEMVRAQPTELRGLDEQLECQAYHTMELIDLKCNRACGPTQRTILFVQVVNECPAENVTLCILS